MDVSAKSFKELSKLIEERFRFGRQMVTIILLLTIGAVVVGLISYLSIALTSPVAWFVTLVKTGNVPSVPSQTVASLLSVLAVILLLFFVWRLRRDLAANVDITKRHVDLSEGLSEQIKSLTGTIALVSERVTLINKRLGSSDTPD
jgi:hypothetical protein